MSDLTLTPVADIPAAHKRVVAKFNTHTTRPIEYRLKQLRKLYWGLKDEEAALLKACKADLGKSAYETWLTEVGWVLNDIIYMEKNLAKFAKDEAAPDAGLINMTVSPKIRKDPMGAVLIIGAFNFPFQLSLGPLVGAIAAGCTAVLKPSENAPESAKIMEKVIKATLDPEAYQVVQGAVAETTALLDLKWDQIFYTGGPGVGKIIAKKAAETLTPCVLELGGRNPAIITKNADVRLAARRLLWAKLLNVGQVCVSQNYILVDKEVLPAFVQQLKVALAEFHPKGSQNNDDYGKVVNERSWQRLKDMLDNSKGKILIGGKTDKATLFFEPTVVEVTSETDSLLASESFGPLIPILAVKDLDEAIRIANEIDSTPLGTYPFGTKAETAKVLASTRSGGVSINDGFFHASIPTLEFGGVGGSGSGSYRGKASFDAFTHRRAVTTTPAWMESLLAVRYPPFTAGKFKQIKMMQDQSPSFDRNGNPKSSLFLMLFGFGAKSTASAGGRWLFIAVVAAAYKFYKDRA